MEQEEERRERTGVWIRAICRAFSDNKDDDMHQCSEAYCAAKGQSIPLMYQYFPLVCPFDPGPSLITRTSNVSGELRSGTLN
ncbi:unnamed protein product [Arctogadus glacialis]